MLSKNQLRDIFTKYSFSPLKRFGENYLIDANIKNKIIESSGITKKDIVVEIGPGFGALTLDLAASGVKVFAVEKDRKAFDIFGGLVGSDFPNLVLINADILEFDLKTAAASKKVKVLGNLPYYITTPIIEYIINNRKLIDSALVMVQREVANRLMAAPGTKDYSSVSCFVQYYTTPSYIHTIKKTSFYPPPDVDSSLIRLEILDAPSVKVRDEELLFKVIRGSFNQRRKSILNSLSRKEVLDMSKDALSAILILAGIDPSARPESLGLAEFAQIADALR